MVDLEALAAELQNEAYVRANELVLVPNSNQLTVYSETMSSSLEVYTDGSVKLFFRDVGMRWWRVLRIIDRHVTEAGR